MCQATTRTDVGLLSVEHTETKELQNTNIFFDKGAFENSCDT